MRLPVVLRSTYMAMVNAANEYAHALQHERDRASQWERRYDDLLRDYKALRREGYTQPVEWGDEPLVTRSIADADEEAARLADLAEMAIADPDETLH
jgi:hypothetical protein